MKDNSMDDVWVERVQALLAGAFQVPVESVPADLSFGGLPQWDSMGHMEVMMRLEQEYGVEINTETISALTDVPSICAYLKEHSSHA